VRSSEGGLFGGCNVENAAYPQGWCAEASAIAAMVGAGHRRIAEVLVLGGGARLCTPCGGCRQKLREFAADRVPVHVCGPTGLRRSVTLGELLPLSFDAGNLAQRARKQ
jgi:cytidine deaminase